MIILADSLIAEAVSLTLVGMGVVFLALLVLLGVVLVLQTVLGDKPERKADVPPATPAPGSPKAAAVPQAAATQPPDDQELIAVIAAAAAAVLGKPARAVRVTRFIQASDDWLARGRHALAASHHPTMQPQRKTRS